MPRFRDDTDFPDFTPMREASSDWSIPYQVRDAERLAWSSLRYGDLLPPERNALSVPTRSVSPELKLDSLSPDRVVSGSRFDPARRLEAASNKANRERPFVRSRSQLGLVTASSYADWTRTKGFNPAGRLPWPSTLYGASAQTALDSSWRQVFRVPTLTIPCIERVTRRQVLFARRKAGRGHRSPKRRTWMSEIGC